MFSESIDIVVFLYFLLVVEEHCTYSVLSGKHIVVLKGRFDIDCPFVGAAGKLNRLNVRRTCYYLVHNQFTGLRITSGSVIFRRAVVTEL